MFIILKRTNNASVLSKCRTFPPFLSSVIWLLLLPSNFIVSGVQLFTPRRSWYFKRCTKNNIFFFTYSEKMFFTKKCVGIDPFCVIRKYIFFSKNMISFFDKKWKMIFLKKIMEIWYVLQPFWKTITPKYDLSFISKKRLYFFFPKIWCYSLDSKWKMIFFKKIHRNVYSASVLKVWSFQKTCTGIWSFYFS